MRAGDVDPQPVGARELPVWSRRRNRHRAKSRRDPSRGCHVQKRPSPSPSAARSDVDRSSAACSTRRCRWPETADQQPWPSSGTPHPGADHHHLVCPPDQGVDRQQHVSAPAARAPRPLRTCRAHRPAQPACSGMSPRPEPTPAPRAHQQPHRQPPLDLRHVLAYRDHGASARLGWPSRRLLQKTTGSAHLLPDAAHRHVVVAHQRHDPPRDRVPATLTTNDAKP